MSEADLYTPIRAFRVKHSLTQPQLAELLGVSDRTVYGWEKLYDLPRHVQLALSGLELELSERGRSGSD